MNLAKLELSDYIASSQIASHALLPWEICQSSSTIIMSWLMELSDSYKIQDGVAIHKTATVEPGAILKAPCIIGENCFVASYAYLRGGVWLESNVIIGPSVEIKSSFICNGSKAAHFNFIGDSIIGQDVNIEAGAILANYRNEWQDKEIICSIGGQKIHTQHDKFGSLLGDGCRIGANAVLAPGSILSRNTIIKRLSLVDQV